MIEGCFLVIFGVVRINKAGGDIVVRFRGYWVKVLRRVGGFLIGVILIRINMCVCFRFVFI